jgi:predicted TIM-barrel fold metal-dependent hydrolase
MDTVYERYRKPMSIPCSMMPSEAFRRHIFVTYQEDDFAERSVGEIGVENIMWASDYPHPASTWPHSRETIAQSYLAKLDERSRRRILFENAAQLYRITYPATVR